MQAPTKRTVPCWCFITLFSPFLPSTHLIETHFSPDKLLQDTLHHASGSKPGRQEAFPGTARHTVRQTEPHPRRIPAKGHPCAPQTGDTPSAYPKTGKYLSPLQKQEGAFSPYAAKTRFCNFCSWRNEKTIARRHPQRPPAVVSLLALISSRIPGGSFVEILERVDEASSSQRH